MNRSEAGKLGWEKAKHKLQERHRRFVELYEKNPKKCRLCDSVILFEKRANDFCSHSCAAAYNNGRRGSNLSPHPCKFCGAVISSRKIRVFCSHQCRANYNIKKFDNRIVNGDYKNPYSSKQVKRFLIAERGCRCEECKRVKWRGQSIPLNVHHVDGDATNNKPENLKLLCLNCHGLTPNFGFKNKGKSTRYYRYNKPPS